MSQSSKLIEPTPNASDPLLAYDDNLPIPDNIPWDEIMNTRDEIATQIARRNQSTEKITPTVDEPIIPTHAPKPQSQDRKLTREQLRRNNLQNEEVLDHAMQTDDYEASFASVADMESLDNRVHAIESTMSDINDKLESLLSEREAIPKQLKRIFADFNKMSTTMSEQIISVKNSQLQIPQELTPTTESFRQRTEELKTLATEISGPPTLSSQVHSEGPLKLKKKISVK